MRDGKELIFQAYGYGGEFGFEYRQLLERAEELDTVRGIRYTQLKRLFPQILTRV